MRFTRASNVFTLGVTAGFIACAMAAQATAANLLLNPGFESPSGTASVDAFATGWTFVEDASRATFQNHTAGGTHSIWLKTFQPLGGGVQQDVGITAGANYSLSGFNYFESSYPTTEAVVVAQVTWLNAGGGAVGAPSRLATQPATVTTTGAWVPFNLNATAPAGATQARVFFGWEGGGPVTGAQSAFVDDVIFDGPGTPPVNSWGATGSGDWNVSTNWITGTVPNGVDAEANFLGAITAPRTVYSDVPVTAGKVKFSNANQYVIAGPGSLTLDVSSGNATIDVLAGSHKINLPLRLNDTTTATVAAGSTLTIADPLTLANGSTLNKAGAGTLEIISTVTSLAGSSAISTSGGTTNLRFQMNAGTAIANSGGETRTFTTQRVSSVNITGGSVALDAAGPAIVVDTDSLTVGAGKLDVGDNGVIARNASAATVRAAIISGRAGGNGIVTTSSLNARSIGYATSAQLQNPATFMGQPFTGPAVLIRYTVTGDTNLTGNVNFDDLVALSQNYGGTGKSWAEGDLNYDGVVNFDDLVPLAQNYNGSLLDSDTLTALGGSEFASDWALASALAPEPTTLAAIAGAMTLVARRRR